MVSSINGSQSSNILAGVSPQGTTPSGSTASFTDQLAAALEGYLAQSAHDSDLEINIQATQSQNSGVRQFIVTVKNPDSASGQTAAAASAVVPAQSTPAQSTPAQSTPVQATPAPASAASTQASAPASAPLDEAAQANLTRAEINAYWAAQPPEVQKLRDISDFGERSLKAQQLADQGYTIDRQIMVWNWDPMKTMGVRKMYGYNWVPSFNQASVSTPGTAVKGQTPYDPDSPPPGSIAVNTDFAKGLGNTSA
jgi:hypothetical protein